MEGFRHQWTDLCWVTKPLTQTKWRLAVMKVSFCVDQSVENVKQTKPGVGKAFFVKVTNFHQMCTYLKLSALFGLPNPDLTFWTTTKNCFPQNEKLQTKVIRDSWDFVQTVSWVYKHSLQFKLLRSSVRLSVLKILSSSTQSTVFRNIPTDLGLIIVISFLLHKTSTLRTVALKDTLVY